MPNTFTLQVNRRDPRPRSPRLKQLGAGSTSGAGTTVLGGQQITGDGHTHANKAALDQISTDSLGYLWLLLEQLVHDELTNTDSVQRVPEKVKAGYADLAALAIDLTQNSPVFGYFLSKINDDTAAGRITFEQGLTALQTAIFAAAVFGGKVSLNSNTGTPLDPDLVINGLTRYGSSLVPGASGAGIWKDEHNNWHAQFDFLRINKKLEALEVEIEKMSHIGGALILSAARCTLTHCDDPDQNEIMRCYFTAKDENGNAITNDWRPGDQAFVQTFNLITDPTTGMTTNRRWWRLVHAVGTTNDGSEHWIDFDVTTDAGMEGDTYDTGSDLPAAGDEVVLLGSRALLSDNSGEDLARQNAIILDSAGTGSPFIRIYKGIRTFQLGNPRIDLNATDPRLDVSSLTITAGGGTKNVGEVIDESFLVWYVTINAPTDQQGNILESVTLGFTGFPDTINQWTSSDYPAHVGDVALTADGVCYRFETSSDSSQSQPSLAAPSYLWIRKADDFLIDALQTANRSAQTLSAMADDSIITAQEKIQLRTLKTQIEQEKQQIVAEAAGFTGLSSTSYVNAFNALHAFLTYLINDSGNTALVRASDGYTLYASEYAAQSTGISTYSVSYVNLSGLVPHGKTYGSAVSSYYSTLTTLRRNITGAVRSEIQTSSATAYDAAVNAYVQYLQQNLSSLIGTAIEGNTAISQFSSLYSTIGNWNWGTDSNGVPSINGAGLLTTSNFASLWASQFVGNQMVASAIMGAFCDQLLDDQGNPVLDDQGNQRWVSRVGINATYFVVDTQNFKVDVEGNVKVTGEVTAKRFVNEMVTIPPLYTASGSNTRVLSISLLKLIADDTTDCYWYKDSSNVWKPFLVGTARNFAIDPDLSGMTIYFPDSDQMEQLCPSGTRLLFYNKAFATGTLGQSCTSRIIEFWNGDPDGGTGEFRGISSAYVAPSSAAGQPVNAYSFTPVSHIQIGNGIIEFMSMPAGNGKVDWVVTRIAASYQNLS
jgi:hypothetical protein